MDVSFVAGSPGVPRPVTGVGRVIGEIFQRLVSFPDMEVRAVGSFGNDWNPISTSHLAEQWAKCIVPSRNVSMSAYQSFTGVSRCLAGWQVTMQGAIAESKKSIAQDIVSRFLRRLLQLDARFSIGKSNTDVFFSTFMPIPIELPKSIPRLFMIYDMYPIRFPESCNASVVGNLKSLLASLDPKRDVFVSISEFTKSDFCNFTGFPKSRVVVSPLAAEDIFQPTIDAFQVQSVRLRLGLGTLPYLLSVANPQPRKNLVTAVRAFARAAASMPDWSGLLVLAGNPKAGWGADAIDEEIREYPNLENRVLRVGAVCDQDLAALYAGATAFIFPSTFEGFGLPVLEAMQCGTPVICSNTTSLPEVVGDAAITCDPMDFEMFAQAIKQLVLGQNDRAYFSNAGINRAKEFSWDRTAECVRNAINLAVEPIF